MKPPLIKISQHIVHSCLLPGAAGSHAASHEPRGSYLPIHHVHSMIQARLRRVIFHGPEQEHNTTKQIGT